MSFLDFFKRKQTAPAAAPSAYVREPANAPEHHPSTSEHDDNDDDSHTGRERRERGRRSARAGTRILVVDDSPTIVALLKRMLEQNHFEVTVAYDGESALEIARRDVPDLIFLDIVLPGVDGFNVLRTLRREPGTKDVPIIMISGNAQATEQFYVQRIGADDFMKKPFARAEIFSRIEPLLDENCVPRHISRQRASLKPVTTASGT